MSLERQAERVLESARKKAIREKLFENLKKFRFEAEHVERNRGDSDWLCRLSATGPNGEVVRGLNITVRTPSALSFERTYEYGLIAFCPIWVEYYHAGNVYRFSKNTRPFLGFE